MANPKRVKPIIFAVVFSSSGARAMSVGLEEEGMAAVSSSTLKKKKNLIMD